MRTWEANQAMFDETERRGARTGYDVVRGKTGVSH